MDTYGFDYKNEKDRILTYKRIKEIKAVLKDNISTIGKDTIKITFSDIRSFEIFDHSIV